MSYPGPLSLANFFCLSRFLLSLFATFHGAEREKERMSLAVVCVEAVDLRVVARASECVI
jgi:hypothetical protein